jgi:hypothetical protein
LQVIPVGIHYECPWAFRSKVEVVFGKAISTEFAPGGTRLARLKELKRRIECGLEEVGINVESAEQQDEIQRLAYAATLATPRSYFRSLKSLEGGVPKAIEEAQTSLRPQNAPAKSILQNRQVTSSETRLSIAEAQAFTLNLGELNLRVSIASRSSAF